MVPRVSDEAISAVRQGGGRVREHLIWCPCQDQKDPEIEGDIPGRKCLRSQKTVGTFIKHMYRFPDDDDFAFDPNLTFGKHNCCSTVTDS